MPDLEFALKKLDLGHLRIIAELWGLEFSAQNLITGVKTLCTMLLNQQMVKEVIDSLPIPPMDGLRDLINNDGELAWSLFTRRYGEIREVGVGRRDREQIYLKPSSPAEILWYRGLIYRDFFDTPSGLQEFAYIPSDLLALIPSKIEPVTKPLGHPATAKEYAIIKCGDDRILDHACTLLAHLRLDLPIEILNSIPTTWPGEQLDSETVPPYPLTPQALTHILVSAGILNDSNELLQDPIRNFLEAPRAQALEFLVNGWLNSTTFNELLMVPGLAAQGEWVNDPLQTRNMILDYLTSIPENIWWSLTAFVEGIKEINPDFQRLAGDYDTWFIRDVNTNEFLRGFENWERVDGTLIRFMLGGPLHWLGMIDLGMLFETAPANAFRITTWAAQLRKGQIPRGFPDENEQIMVQSDARLQVPRLSPRSARYQIARSCTWEGEKNDSFIYRITPGSLERAHNQGIHSSHLLALLQKHAKTVPPSLVKALQLWEQNGSAATIEEVFILRVRNPKLIPILRKSRAARFLGDTLGRTTLVIKPGSQEKVVAILAELGYLAEIIG